MPAVKRVRHAERQIQGRGGNVRGVTPAGRKDAPCDTCGAKPGHACWSLASVKQVNAGKPGAYLKPQKTLHTGRGMAAR